MTTPTWQRSPKICQGLQWTILFDSACLGCRFYMLFGIDCYITTKKKIHMESDLKFEVLHLQGIPGTNKNPSFRKLPVNSCLGSGWVGFFGWSQDRLENTHLVCRDTTSTEISKGGGYEVEVGCLKMGLALGDSVIFGKKWLEVISNKSKNKECRKVSRFLFAPPEKERIFCAFCSGKRKRWIWGHPTNFWRLKSSAASSSSIAKIWAGLFVQPAMRV